MAVNSDVAMPTRDGDGEAAHRPGAEHEQHHMRPGSGRVAVEDGAEGAAEARVSSAFSGVRPVLPPRGCAR